MAKLVKKATKPSSKPSGVQASGVKKKRMVGPKAVKTKGY